MYVTYDSALDWHLVEVEAEKNTIFGASRVEHRDFILWNCTRGNWSMTWEARNEPLKGTNRIIRFKRPVYVFAFEDKTDAMHFKLRFG